MHSPKLVFHDNGVGACRYKLLFLSIFVVQIMMVSETNAAAMRRFFVAWDKTALLRNVKLSTFHVEDATGRAGISIPVRITLPSATEFAQEGGKEGTFILIRNVPLSISFSAGLPSGRNWIMTLDQAKAISLVSMPDTIGEFRLEFDLIGPKKRQLGQQSMVVTILPSQKDVNTAAIPQEIEKTTIAAVSANTAEANDPVSVETPFLPKKEEAILLKRGDEILRQGGIAGARLIFEDLARRGSQKGAFVLAQTYDPAFIKDLPKLGISPDIEKALKWYNRAWELGNAAAKERHIQLEAVR